jgi:hypothetical protein
MEHIYLVETVAYLVMQNRYQDNYKRIFKYNKFSLHCRTHGKNGLALPYFAYAKGVPTLDILSMCAPVKRE